MFTRSYSLIWILLLCGGAFFDEAANHARAQCDNKCRERTWHGDCIYGQCYQRQYPDCFLCTSLVVNATGICKPRDSDNTSLTFCVPASVVPLTNVTFICDACDWLCECGTNGFVEADVSGNCSEGGEITRKVCSAFQGGSD